MKILNSYAGIGGNRKLWGTKHDITAIELDPDIAKIYSDFYPGDTVIVADAHEYLLNHYSEFDIIWSSPPCQTHSRLANSSQKGNGIIRYPDVSLYQEITFLKHFYTGRWIVENVDPYYKPWIDPYTKLCRHLLWCNFNIRHSEMKDPLKGVLIEHPNEVKIIQEILNINLSGCHLPGMNKKRSVLRNCVNPELGKHILDCATGSIINETQLGLFK